MIKPVLSWVVLFSLLVLAVTFFRGVAEYDQTMETIIFSWMVNGISVIVMGAYTYCVWNKYQDWKIERNILNYKKGEFNNQ